MEWWLQPVESFVSLFASAPIMAPICVTGCLVILSLCCLVCTLRASKPTDEELDGFEELEDGDGADAAADHGAEDGQSSLPLMPRGPSAVGERDPACVCRNRSRLPRQDRVRVAKDVLPGFGIVLAIVFALLLFVVITTLHRAEGLPLRCPCRCLIGDERDGERDNEAARESLQKTSLPNRCKCFCKNQWFNLLETISWDSSQCGCNDNEILIATQSEENPEEISVGNQYPELKQYSHKEAAKDSYYASSKHNDDHEGMTFRAMDGKNSTEGLSPTVALVRKKRHDAEGKWEFFSPKNTDTVIVVGLLAAVLALGICHVLSHMQHVLHKMCAKLHRGQNVVVYHKAPQPM